MQQPQLGLKILELRKQKGLTQEELVDQCNINVRTLQRIESGEVSPRSYTIKTILSALDYDYETLNEIGDKKAKIIEITSKDAKSIHALLTTSLIAGVLFLIAAAFEGVADYIRFNDGELIYGVAGHVTLKAAIILLNGLLLYGFLIAGNLLKNHLMKISSILMFFVLLCFYAFDIISVFNQNLEVEIVFFAGAIGFGVVGILFGISILQSRQLLGGLTLASGIVEIIMAAFLLTVILAPLSWFLLLPAIILEILLLYKITKLVKEQF